VNELPCLCNQVKLQEFVKIADTVYEVDAAALCDEDRIKYSRVVDFKVEESHILVPFGISNRRVTLSCC